MTAMDEVPCGAIIGAHGVRGEVKIRSLLDDGALEALPRVTIAGREYPVLGGRTHKSMTLLRLGGVDTLEAAMALRGQAVSCRRDDLRLPEGGYLYGDLYGFEVYDLRLGRAIGVLESVQEGPAGMIYVVEDVGATFLIPAVDAFQRGVDFAEKRLTVETIPGMLPHEN
jgi:16S rRNA processing protein RimM